MAAGATSREYGRDKSIGRSDFVDFVDLGYCTDNMQFVEQTSRPCVRRDSSKSVRSCVTVDSVESDDDTSQEWLMDCTVEYVDVHKKFHVDTNDALSTVSMNDLLW